MPQAFSDHEKEVIRQQLRVNGAVLFERQGVRKTTVEELAVSAGISKGAFYLFYSSKEELYLEILEEIERDIHSKILDFTVHSDEDTHRNLYLLLRNAFITMEEYPILRSLHKSDVEYLVRKLPPERVLQHVNNDQSFVDELFNKFNAEGIQLPASPQIVSNLIKSLFFVELHQEDFGSTDYDELIDTLIDLVAGYITGDYNARCD